MLGLSADGTGLFGPRMVNAANGVAVASYPDPAFSVDGTGQPYAFHSGGLNALMGDGGVRFVSESVEARAFTAAVTRGGGEVASLD